PRARSPASTLLQVPANNRAPLASSRLRGLGHGDACLVGLEPGGEIQHAGVQGTGPLEIATRAVRDFEVALELPHVAELVGTRETKGAERVGRNRVVGHVFAE